MAIELVVRPGVDSAFLAWRAPFIAGCRGFALFRRVKRAPGSVPSPSAKPDKDGFLLETVASWVGFASQPAPKARTRKPTPTWPSQKYVRADFAAHPGHHVSHSVT